jgi:lipoprotein-releasing system ATP-binding protein
MLELIDVRKDYPSPGRGENLTVLRDISLKVEDGKAFSVVGPSGSGKSTLLNIIGALDRPTSGKVLLDGVDIGQLDDKQLAKIRSQRIGFVFQLHHLLPQCTVLENVLIPTLAAPNDGDKSEIEERAVNLLNRVGLKDWLAHKPGQLSGGQRQRVAVARALINSPALLLADEPTGSLDKASSDNVADLLTELNRSDHVTMIVVTHSLPLAERVGHVLQLENGTLTERQPD